MVNTGYKIPALQLGKEELCEEEGLEKNSLMNHQQVLSSNTIGLLQNLVHHQL